MTEQDETLKNRFKAYLSAKISGAKDITITNFIRKTEGYSYETYLVDAQWAEGNNTTSQGFAIRMVPDAGVVEPYNIEAHYKILEVVEDPRCRPPSPTG